MRLILCHGCFDILHYGHFDHLRQARTLGDRLIVSVTAAPWVERQKGKGHPAHTDEERLSQLRELRCVDGVYLCNYGSAAPAIRFFRPYAYVKGSDYAGHDVIKADTEACREVGALILYTTTPKRSVVDMVTGFQLNEVEEDI